MSELTCVIITHNSQNDISRCVTSVLESSCPPNIIVFDNNSTDRTLEILNDYSKSIRITKSSENLGYAKACNQASKEINTKYICFLNPDASVKPDTLSTLTDFMDKNPNTAIVGPLLVGDDEVLKNSAARFPLLVEQIIGKGILRFLFPNFFYNKAGFYEQREVESLVGACFMIRTDLFRQLGGFNENYFFALEETELCLNASKAGFSVFIVPEAKVMHIGGKSKKQYNTRGKIEYYISLITYFRLNKPFYVFGALLTLLPIKWILSTILNLGMYILTLFSSKKLKSSLKESAVLSLWSILLYPKSWGIKYGGKK